MTIVRRVLLGLMAAWTLIWVFVTVQTLLQMTAVQRSDQLMPGILVMVGLLNWSVGMLPLWLIRHVIRPRRVPSHSHA